MTKRRTYDSDDYYPGNTDDRIGLTSAFEPVRRDPQAVKYDKGDQAIGLTEAFARVGADEPPSWNEEAKWDGFDWNADWGTDADYAFSEDGLSERVSTTDSHGAEGADDRAVYADAAAIAPETVVSTPFKSESRDFDVQKDLAHASAVLRPGGAASRGKHSGQDPETARRMWQSHRRRRLLIVIIVLLVLALCALIYFGFRTVSKSQEEAAHQAQEQIEAAKDNVTKSAGDDTVETAAQQTDVPTLTTLFGKTSDEAIAELARGAFVTNNQANKDKKSSIKTNITVSLADEPSDSKTGTPLVYLGLDKNGKIIQTGYSAAASALGFGSLSFADAVNNEHVIEQTLRKVGVAVDDGVATLPEDSSKYVTYGKDGKTVVKERCSFEGEADVNGTPCTWSAVLSYDYTTQTITGNLSDTVRIIYVYVTKK
ncbi:MAG: hypothetical protein IJH88_04875 [Eggerthellaceae bacterium]|nr:hypothetical protein [Eggerthellaceae bacterium]